MSKIASKVPESVREYRAARQAWDLAAAEWLGLDPEVTFALDVDLEPAHVEARWEAVSQVRPGRGRHTLGAYCDAELTTFTGEVALDYGESVEFREAVGPKPELFTPEEAARLRAAIERPV